MDDTTRRAIAKICDDINQGVIDQILNHEPMFFRFQKQIDKQKANQPMLEPETSINSNPQTVADGKDALFTRVEHDLALHPPTSIEAAIKVESQTVTIRNMYTAMASDVIDICPLGRDLSMALTDLETSMRCAIAAVVKNQPPVTDQ